jgi:hypothetical protein
MRPVSSRRFDVNDHDVYHCSISPFDGAKFFGTAQDTLLSAAVRKVPSNNDGENCRMTDHVRRQNHKLRSRLRSRWKSGVLLKFQV